jgi:hypothetical protein
MTLEERIAALEAALFGKADVAAVDMLDSRLALLENAVDAMTDEASDMAAFVQMLDAAKVSRTELDALKVEADVACGVK